MFLRSLPREVRLVDKIAVNLSLPACWVLVSADHGVEIIRYCRVADVLNCQLANAPFAVAYQLGRGGHLQVHRNWTPTARADSRHFQHRSGTTCPVSRTFQLVAAAETSPSYIATCVSTWKRLCSTSEVVGLRRRPRMWQRCGAASRAVWSQRPELQP